MPLLQVVHARRPARDHRPLREARRSSDSLRAQTIIGPQSDEAARAALAAGEQDRLWQFADLFYRNQDDENSGYVTDEFIRTLFENTPGVNVGQAVNDLGSAGVGDSLSRSKNAFDRLGLSATPTFVLVHQGQESDPFGAGEVQSKLEAALP